MSYVLSLVVAATVLGATQAGSEEVGLGVSVRWVDNGVTVGTSQNNQLIPAAMSASGQTEKNSVRAHVFRFALELGHCSTQLACLKRAIPERGGKLIKGSLRSPIAPISRYRHPHRYRED